MSDGVKCLQYTVIDDRWCDYCPAQELSKKYVLKLTLLPLMVCVLVIRANFKLLTYIYGYHQYINYPAETNQYKIFEYSVVIRQIYNQGVKWDNFKQAYSRYLFSYLN